MRAARSQSAGNAQTGLLDHTDRDWSRPPVPSVGTVWRPDGSLTTVEGNASKAVSVEHHSPGEATGFVRL